MTETTFEEARRCFKCEEPSKFTGMTAAPRRAGILQGTMLHSFMCVNERCKAYGTIVRIIQVNPDGTIPPATLKRDKQFPLKPDLVAEVQQAVDRQLAAETNKDGTAEISR